MFYLLGSLNIAIATTTNITTYGTQTIDGIQLAVNDKVLVKNQSTAASNGVYVVQNTDWTRDTSLNSTSFIFKFLTQ